MKKTAKFLVSEVQPTNNGDGFTVHTERQAPLVTFAYDTRQDAMDAREMVKAAIMKVVSVDVARR
ncbi:MAG TPA: hypothetical protein VKA03_01285 [Methylovirgula sp.]|nr:hypothetical protein [Methylovirgula sp.]